MKARTRLMQMLGISVPIIAAPLGRGVTPPFLGALHDAGAIGFIGLTHFSPEDIPALLAPIAAATGGHFGVNLSLIADKRGQLRSALAAGARIVSLWQDNPAEYVRIAKDAGAVVLWTVGSPQEAARAREMGVDIVVAQGSEAGGHLVGKAPTMTHLAAIVAAADGLPVAAAGGIANGPGVAAALTLGAEAVWLGTRFVASTEAALHEGYKARVVAARAEEAVETRLYDIGWPDSPHRVLRNETIAAWERAGRPPPGARPGEGDIVGHHPDGTPSLRYHIGSATTGFEGDWAATPMYAGTSVQFVQDVQPVSVIIATLMRDAAQAAQHTSAILQPVSEERLALKTTRRTILGGSAVLAGSLAMPAIGRAAGPEFVYKFGVDLPAAHPTSVWAQKAADRIKAETDGRMEMQVFPNGQLGSSTDMTSQLRSGALEFLSQSGPVLSQLVPAASINSVGFAFKSEDEVWRALDGDLGAYIRAQIEKAGLVVMDRIWSLGFRQITNAANPIKGPADLKGMKIRVPPGAIFITLFRALSASPTSINYNELYSALQSHVVDGQENPVGVLVAARLYEVQKYLSITNHMWAGYWFLANRRAFEALPADIRATVSKIVNESGLEQRAQLAREDGAYLKELGEKGLVINETQPDEFRAALIQAGYYKEAQARFGEQPWALMENYTGKLG